MTARTIFAAAGLAALGLATAAPAQAPATGTPAPAATPAEAPAPAATPGNGAGAATATAPASPGGGQPANRAGAGTAAATHLAGPAAPEGAAPPAMPAEEKAAAEAAPPAEGLPPDTKAVTFENGRWYNAEGIPTFKIEDGKLDYASFSGYRRYHAECHVCHGPDGEGSTYAPALKNSVMRVTDYYQFQQIVASGKQDVGAASNLVMPAFGTNRNVWCYVDDIYSYLLARGTDAIPRGRPAERAEKSDEFAAIENSCMEG